LTVICKIDSDIKGQTSTLWPHSIP